MALLSDSEARQIQHSWKIDSPRLPDWGLQAVKDLVRYEADRQERIERERRAGYLLMQYLKGFDPYHEAKRFVVELGYGEEKP